jgi:branched-chain amino acid transport system ATP-binding protein
MLEVRDLKVRYGNVEAIKGISFDVKEREIVTLIGSNGAGKSSTLMAISNLAKKSAGTARFLGADITSLDPSEIAKRGICHVPEGRRIFPYLTVEENLLMGDYGNTDPDPKRCEKNMETAYSLFPRLKERKKQNGGTLSGGEQQMLAIARGLMLDPKLVMLDEPSLGLAPIIVEQIFELLLRIREMGKTILLIEQNASMALQIADRGYVLETGRITLSGSAEELSSNPEVIRAYLGV